MNYPRKYFLLALMLTLVASACVKDPEPTGGGGGSNEPETSIAFTCFINDSVYLPGVFIGITPNEADRDNGVYLFSGTSNSIGEVEFTELEPITYYYGASYSSPSGTVTREASITLEEGDEVNRDLKF